MKEKTITPVAYIRTDYPTKFGIPRQCGLVENEARIEFVKEFQSPDCIRELEGYTHIWLIWGFSENEDQGWTPTVRPPRLGGNRRVGVFASRSPFRPNGLGLSVVRLRKVVLEGAAPVIYVTGADLMDKTPIYDIKPYMPYSDSIPDAVAGYAQSAKDKHLDVHCSPDVLNLVPEGKRTVLLECLALDPRPSYQDDPDRIYGMRFADFDVRFQVRGNDLTIKEIVKAEQKNADR